MPHGDERTSYTGFCFENQKVVEKFRIFLRSKIIKYSTRVKKLARKWVSLTSEQKGENSYKDLKWKIDDSVDVGRKVYQFQGT